MHKDSGILRTKHGENNSPIKIRIEEARFLRYLQAFYRHKCILEGEFIQETDSFRGPILPIMKRVSKLVNKIKQK